jgi:hypothetical protein
VELLEDLSDKGDQVCFLFLLHSMLQLPSISHAFFFHAIISHIKATPTSAGPDVP